MKQRILKVTEEFMEFIKKMSPGSRMPVMAYVRGEDDVDEEFYVTIERDPVDGDFYFRFES